ncbi:MAG: hypothetical protein Q4A41_01040, partial [Bacillota bacterium]|nr:hypothetical protein [Bacillota bacterium]
STSTVDTSTASTSTSESGNDVSGSTQLLAYEEVSLYPRPDMTVEEGVFYLYKRSKGLEYQIEPELIYEKGDIRVLSGYMGEPLASGLLNSYECVRFYRGERLFVEMATVGRTESRFRTPKLVTVIENEEMYALVLVIAVGDEEHYVQEFWSVDLHGKKAPLYLGTYVSEGGIRYTEMGDSALGLNGDLYMEDYILESDMTDNGEPLFKFTSQLVKVNLLKPNGAEVVREGFDVGFLRNREDSSLDSNLEVIDRRDEMKESEIAAIWNEFSGTWRLDGAQDTAYFTIEPDGTFVSYYASGAEEFRGKIEIVGRGPKFVVWREDGEKVFFMYYLDYSPNRGTLGIRVHQMHFDKEVINGQ